VGFYDIYHTRRGASAEQTEQTMALNREDQGGVCLIGACVVLKMDRLHPSRVAGILQGDPSMDPLKIEEE